MCTYIHVYIGGRSRMEQQSDSRYIKTAHANKSQKVRRGRQDLYIKNQERRPYSIQFHHVAGEKSIHRERVLNASLTFFFFLIYIFSLPPVWQVPIREKSHLQPQPKKLFDCCVPATTTKTRFPSSYRKHGHHG